MAIFNHLVSSAGDHIVSAIYYLWEETFILFGAKALKKLGPLTVTFC